MTSKISATPTVTTMTIIKASISGGLDDNARDDIGHFLTAVGGFLQPFEYLLPFDDHHGVILFIEQMYQGGAEELIAVILGLVDFDTALLDALTFLVEARQITDSLVDLRGGGDRKSTRLN